MNQKDRSLFMERWGGATKKKVWDKNKKKKE